MRRFPALVACSVLLLVAACGGSSGSANSGALPTVSGSYGDKPTMSFPGGKPPATLEHKVLHAGTGPAVARGDLLVADYLGQIWKGKVFDNSYDRKQPAAFPIGVGKVIPGWDKTLVGVKAGSRVLLSVPPADGYGAQGQPQAGITGTDTLEFVVDVVKSYPPKSGGDPNAVPQKAPATGPKVTGALGAQPTVTVAKNTPKPTKTVTTVLAKGHGPTVTPGLVVVQYQAVDWTGKSLGSTWQDGTPAGVPIGDPAQKTPFDSLVGVPVGSRVLIQIPVQQGQGPIAVAVDIVGQPGTAKQAAAG